MLGFQMTCLSASIFWRVSRFTAKRIYLLYWTNMLVQIIFSVNVVYEPLFMKIVYQNYLGTCLQNHLVWSLLHRILTLKLMVTFILIIIFVYGSNFWYLESILGCWSVFFLLLLHFGNKKFIIVVIVRNKGLFHVYYICNNSYYCHYF